MMLRLLRQLLNLLIAGLLMYGAYHASIALVDHLLTRVQDDFIVSIIKTNPMIVGSLGVFLSVAFLGVIILLHDIGAWFTSWLWRTQKDNIE